MSRPRLGFHTWPAAVYAIGDVHGCLDQLLALEARIIDDAASIEGEKWLVTVGDHIDRGPNSAGVIEHLRRSPPPGFRRFSLLGNHEAMMLHFLANPDPAHYWLDEGGTETLQSFGIDPFTETGLYERPRDRLPRAAIDFLETLPISLALPGWLFVHAGIRPGVPLTEQSDEDMIWIRGPFLSAQLTGGLRIVHGHTPGRDIVVTPHRIDIDTHCYHSGKLSAVRVTPDGATHFLSVQL